MSRATSFFLDLLRLLAAGTVFASHCVLFWSTNPGLGWAAAAGHRAVVVFFVLSGYVIAYSTLRQPMKLRDYVAARLSRLYSVVLPALVLTAVLQIVGTRLNPTFYETFHRGHEILRYFLTTFFLQSLWTSNTAPPTDGPFWSLGYEFWYYAVFGAAVFIKPVRMKVLGVIVLLIVSGIDSWLLMPSWVAGALLYIYGRKGTISRGWASVGAAVALAGSLLSILKLPNWPGHYGSPPFFFSNAFLTDGLVGLLLTALIGLADQAFRSSNVPERLDAVVRWTADHTFSLYLYHYPILLFVTAVIPFDRKNAFQIAGMTVLILAMVLLLSLVTEAPRNRWRIFFGGCWDFCAHRSGQPRSAG